MLKKKYLALVSVVVVAMLALFALAGCGNNGGAEQKQGASQEAGQTQKKDADKNEADQKTEITSAEFVEPGYVTFVSDYQFPPFEYMEGTDKKGFSIDLSNALCQAVGLQAKWADPIKFDAIVPVVQQGGKVDAGWASITITDERKQEVDFTDPYLDSNQGVAVAESSDMATLEDLDKAGKKVAVQSGSTGEEWAKENLKNAEVVTLDDNVAGFAALEAGQVDAVALDLPVMQWMINDAYKGKAKVIAEIPTGEQYGIVVSKDNPELTKLLNKGLAEIKKNGEYDKIYTKYFGDTK